MTPGTELKLWVALDEAKKHAAKGEQAFFTWWYASHWSDRDLDYTEVFRIVWPDYRKALIKDPAHFWITLRAQLLEFGNEENGR